MKKFSIAILPESVRKNKSPIAAFSLLLMIVAASSIFFCDKEISALGKKWRSLYELKEVWGYEDPKAMGEGQLRDLTRYDIKVSLKRFVSRRTEIRFCDRYSFVLSGDYKPSGVYYKTGRGQEKHVSIAKYPHAPPMSESQRLESLRLHLKCDLVEKMVRVYMNGTFMEKIPLGPEPVHYAFGLVISPGRKQEVLNKLEISDQKGNVLFKANFFPLFFYKFISQAFLSLGVLIFFALACSERRLFKKALFFVFPLLFLEIFLRAVYPHDPALDIAQLKPKWRFEISTNFYGAFNDPKELTIRSYWKAGKALGTYPIANPEHATRIICVGSSPLLTGAPSAAAAFPALLEKKLNAWNQKKNTVIPLAAPYAVNFNSPEVVIFLKEVLKKINPDLLLFYGILSPPNSEYYKKQFEKDYALYRRAKRVMEKNSDWIKSDRLLYAALEFKAPVKEIVYLYDFLCKSYLFMAVENIRKKFPSSWRSGDRRTLVEDPDSFFEEVIKSCKEKGIKVVFIPQLDLLTGSSNKLAEILLMNFRREHPEIYYLSLEGISEKNKSFPFATDQVHFNKYGHEVIAEELARQLTEKKLLNIHKGL